MTSIMKKGHQKIMYLFYKNKNQRFHLREIARKTRLHEPSVTRFLRELEKEEILKSEKEGNLKKYFLKKNKKTFFIFQLFDLERFQKLPYLRQSAINYFWDNLPEKPILMILFGSTAKGTFNETSDLDLLLIVNRKIKTEKAEKEAEAQTAIKINSFQITYRNFLKELKLKEDKVIQSALNTGYPLINHILYYEVLYNERI